MTVTYPDGYGTRRVTLAAMKARHGDKMHPEFARRFFAYMEHKAGLLGVGGGWRDTQPDLPGFAPDGKSFHQDQRFASGFVGYAAVDLVKGNAPGIHVSPAWGDTSDAADYGLHTFITGEPWHIQCVEMRGWQTWVNAGRPDPPRIQLPGTPPPVPKPPPIIDPPPEQDDDMQPSFYVIDTKLRGTFACIGGRWVPWLLEVPKDAPQFTGDHVYIREQILHDQGEPAAALWRERGG